MLPAGLRFLGAIVLVSACAGSSSHRIVGPDGRESYRIKCHPDIDDCWEEAGKVCGASGYDVVSQSEHLGGTVEDFTPGQVTWHVALIRCREQ